MAKRSWLPGPLASFAVRITVLLVLISVVPLVGLALLQDYYTRQMLAQLDERRVNRLLEATLERLTGHLADRFEELETLADHPLIRRQFTNEGPAPGTAVDQVVRSYLDGLPHRYDLLLVSGEGQMLRAIPEDPGEAYIDWQANLGRLPFRTLYQDRDRGLLGPTWLSDAPHESVFLFQRAYADETRQQPIGLLVMHLDVNDLVTEMRANAGDALQPYLQSPLGDYYPSEAEGGGQPNKIVATTPLLEGWQLLISVEESLLMAPLTELRRTLLLVFLAVLVGMLVLVAMVYRQSAGRIRKLTQGAEAIARGNLDWRLEDHGRDELSRLSAAFNGMAEQLRTLIETTVQSEKMASLGKLATTIAHEVRNPLASIKTGVQVVREDLDDPDQERILGNVIAEIDRLNRVASELLTFSRPVTQPGEATPVERIVDRVRALIDRQAAKQQIHVAAQVDPELRIRVDPDQMQQVLMNLVLNSIHAMPAGGELTLRARGQDHRVEIDVADTGVGMSPDLLERVQHPFVSSREDGTGLGLSVSQQLVERNRGRLSIRSAPQQGTTVTLSFPAA